MNRIAAVFVFATILAGCGDSLPEQDANDKNMKPIMKDKQQDAKKNASQVQTKTGTAKTASPSKPASPPAAPATESPGAVSGTVSSVVNYGTGYTHLSIKKKQEEKLKQIQGEHNRKIENAIQE